MTGVSDYTTDKRGNFLTWLAISWTTLVAIMHYTHLIKVYPPEKTDAAMFMFLGASDFLLTVVPFCQLMELMEVRNAIKVPP